MPKLVQLSSKLDGERPASSCNTRASDRKKGRVSRYRATLTSGSLKVAESRVIADLLLQGADAHGWHIEIQEQNVLQARSPETARRLSRLLRARLELMQPPLWKMVRDGSTVLATHACLAAAVKHSPLLGDFLDLVVREQYRLFRAVLSNPLWEHYIEDCRNRDPAMSEWSESTVARLRSTVFQTLAQAGYIESTQTLKLQAVHIAQEVRRYLHVKDERYVLRCIEVGP